MAFGLCQDCRYWTPTILFTTSIHHCAHAEGVNGLPIVPTNAWAYDLERYRALLITNADFGCVQFQQKEPA